MEEVNAWRTYEQTGNNARALHRQPHHHHHHHQRRQQPRYTRHGSLRQRRSGTDDDSEEEVSRSRHSQAALSEISRSRHSAVPILSASMEQLPTTPALLPTKPPLPHSQSTNEVLLYSEEAALLSTNDDSEQPTANNNNKTKKKKNKKPLEQKADASALHLLLLNDSLKRDMRRLFGVYFGGSLDDDRHAPPSLDASGYHQAQHQTVWYAVTHRGPFTALQGTVPWLPQYVASRFGHAPWLKHLLLWTDAHLRGIAQVYFQNNPFSGALILAGLLYQSTRIAVYGVVALMAGNGFARMLGLDAGLWASGLFGYNAVLVGLALATFDSGSGTSRHGGYDGALLALTVVFASFSSLLFVAMGKVLVPYKSPPLTFPFNVATIVFFLASFGMGRNWEYDSVRTPSLPAPNDDNSPTISVLDFAKGTLRGIGQVYLADELWSGGLILAGIALGSRISAAAAVVGSALGNAVALALGVSRDAIVFGLWGYNASLTAAGILLFYAPTQPAVLYSVLGAGMTVLGQLAVNAWLEPYGLPAMTVPFCVIGLPFIIVQGTTSKMIAIPLASMTTPEDHRRRVHMLKYGFSLLMESIHPPEDDDDGEHAHKKKNAQQRKLHQSSRRLDRSLSGISKVINRRHELQAEWASHTSHDNSSGDNDPHTNHYPHRPLRRRRHHHNKEDEWVLEAANAIFSALDDAEAAGSGGGGGHVRVSQFVAGLQAAGLRSPQGVQFASQVFELLDLDGNSTLERDEFGSLALVSRALREIRYNVQKFVHFVDADASGTVEIDEMNDALAYLGEPLLTEADCHALLQAAALQHVPRNDDDETDFFLDDDDDDPEAIDAVELINCVTAQAVKHLIHQYHKSHPQNNKSSKKNAARQPPRAPPQRQRRQPETLPPPPRHEDLPPV